MTFGRVILGDNQFLGVNHASLSKAEQLQDRFADAEAILAVIGWAYDAGIRYFMFTTHDRLRAALREIVRSRLFPGLGFIPCLPYAHKYADSLSEGGLTGVVRDHFLGNAPKGGLLASAGRFALGDFDASIQLLVEVEILMTAGLDVRGIFLQNLVFDLLLGLNAHRLLERFHRYVGERCAVTPGYITMNHPLAQRVLCDEIGIPAPWLCANFNVAGFRIHPSQTEVEASFANGKTRNIAMSVLASGSLSPSAAIAYARDFGGVDSIVFGSGQRQHIEANVALIRSTGPEGGGPERSGADAGPRPGSD